jgi:hypothetical protein
MPTLKYYDGSDWQYAAIGKIGPTGPTGVTGATGATGPTAGMVLLNTTSFSAVASQSVNDVFSSSYDNYKILINVTSSDNEGLAFRYRVSGADNTTSNYHQHIAFVSSASGSYSGANYASATNFYVSSSNGINAIKGIDLTVYNPFLSTNTLLTGLHTHSAAAGAGNYNGGFMEGGFSATTSFTGFSIFPNSGTITGSISVFGVNK